MKKNKHSNIRCENDCSGIIYDEEGVECDCSCHEERPSKASRTLTPWEVVNADNNMYGDADIKGFDGSFVIESRHDNGVSRANAESIVRAVNSYESSQFAINELEEQKAQYIVEVNRLQDVNKALLEAAKVIVDELPELIRQTPYGAPMTIANAFDTLKEIVNQAEGRK